MRTLLIVEDERAIRQGIRAIVQRSGLPVEEIVECRNGNEALQELQRRPVDVMITDIRMPGMDGLALVKRAGALEQPPLMLVISGYDEFSYAVDVFRDGVRDYLVKPIERDRLVELLGRLEQELQHRRREREGRAAAGRLLLRGLLLGDAPPQGGLEALDNRTRAFLERPYAVLCAPPGLPEWEQLRAGSAYADPDLEGHCVLLLEAAQLAQLESARFAARCIGLSQPHSGARQLQSAYAQAVQARGAAFLRGGPVFWQPNEASHAGGDVAAEVQQILHLTAAGHPEQAGQALSNLVLLVQNRRIGPDALAQGLRSLSSGLQELMPGEVPLQQLWHYANIFDCYRACDNAVRRAAQQLQLRREGDVQQRIHQAMLYVQQHYLSELDMAQVSQQIGMNYTQFSQQFRRVAGMPFPDYLKGLRVEEGKRLLRETDLRIRELSRRAGFQSEKHFMKVFKQFTGITPGEYRRAERLKRRPV